jgi:hypothetical protein
MGHPNGYSVPPRRCIGEIIVLPRRGLLLASESMLSTDQTKQNCSEGRWNSIRCGPGQFTATTCAGPSVRMTSFLALGIFRTPSQNVSPNPFISILWVSSVRCIPIECLTTSALPYRFLHLFPLFPSAGTWCVPELKCNAELMLSCLRDLSSNIIRLLQLHVTGSLSH